MLEKIAIIGAGVSGALLAHRIQHHYDVTVLDKARGAGGRISRLKKNDFCFDKGAQDFLLQDEQAMGVIQPAINLGMISPWAPRFMMLDGSTKQWIDTQQKPYFCGHGNLNQVVKWWLEGVRVHYSTCVTELQQRGQQWFLITDKHERLGPFDRVVMTQPVPQVLPLAPEFETALGDVAYSSCMMLYLGLEKPLPSTMADVILSHQTEARWIIQNHRKPGMPSSESLTIQSKSHAYDELKQASDAFSVQMIQDVENILGQTLNFVLKEQHIWRYAKCLNAQNKGSLWDSERKLGVIGDALGPATSSGIESAILSALDGCERLM
ncbi:MAG: NAD(P)-binding protein [Legionellaceae bacterium]|nr:NAD(P)-binding protein [Legionellaceae bacterium]